MNRSVFISSTYEDMKDFRRRVWETLRSFAADVRGMEEFGARKEAPLATCLAEVEQADIFVCILGFRLGSVDETSGKSFTQREYERAYELTKDIRIYLMDDEAAMVPARFVDYGDRYVKLQDFKRLLRDRHTVASFTSPEDLGKKIDSDLRSLLSLRARATEATDEFADSALILRKFLLVPREYSDQKVRLTVRVSGNPFPASREICGALNLPFGRTVGRSISIIAPAGFMNVGLDEIYARGDQVAHLLAPASEALEVEAVLQFIDKPIERLAAQFKTVSGSLFTGQPQTASTVGMQNYRVEADSKLALLLSNVVSGNASIGTSGQGGNAV